MLVTITTPTQRKSSLSPILMMQTKQKLFFFFFLKMLNTAGQDQSVKVCGWPVKVSEWLQQILKSISGSDAMLFRYTSVL